MFVGRHDEHLVWKVEWKVIKVPSGLIRSAWDLEYLKRFQRAAPYKNGFNLLLLRHRVCIKYYLPIGWRTYIWYKNPRKCCTILVCIAGRWNSSNILLMRRSPKNNCRLSHISGARFDKKNCGLCPSNLSAEKVGGLDGFLYDVAQNFEVFQIFKIKIIISGWCPFQGLYTSATLMQI